MAGAPVGFREMIATVLDELWRSALGAAVVLALAWLIADGFTEQLRERRQTREWLKVGRMYRGSIRAALGARLRECVTESRARRRPIAIHSNRRRLRCCNCGVARRQSAQRI